MDDYEASDEGVVYAPPPIISELDPETHEPSRDDDPYTFLANTPTENPEHSPVYPSPSLSLLGVNDSMDLPRLRAIKVHELDRMLDMLDYQSLEVGAVNGVVDAQNALDRFRPEFEAKLYNVLCKDLFDDAAAPTWYVQQLVAVPLTKEAALRTLALRDNAIEMGLLKETSAAASRSSRAALIVACVSIWVALSSVAVAAWQSTQTQDVRITDAPAVKLPTPSGAITHLPR